MPYNLSPNHVDVDVYVDVDNDQSELFAFHDIRLLYVNSLTSKGI